MCKCVECDARRPKNGGGDYEVSRSESFSMMPAATATVSKPADYEGTV